MYRYIVQVKIDIVPLVEQLRREGSDRADVEVKTAAGGLPRSLASTLSAFANTPGGGLVVLGLDEGAGFVATGLDRPSVLLEGLAAMARQALDPPITFEAEQVPFEGSTLVVARIDELPSSAKPCRVGASGKAYLRAHDGDYELSQPEVQALLAARETPTSDTAAVPGTSASDLDPDLLPMYLRSRRAGSPRLATMDDAEVLQRTGVTTREAGELSVAGLLAMGVYPQQHLPMAVIRASVAPRRGDPPRTRVADACTFDGPLPTMLDEAVAWVSRSTTTALVTGTDGHVRDAPEIPPEAVRELVANALIHRDLGPWALTQATMLTVGGDRVALTNPGGLWGITVDRLGRSGVTSARNGRLLQICQHLRSSGDQRVVEALASGIPTVLAAAEAAGLERPGFFDQGIRFSVVIPRRAVDDLASPPPARRGTGVPRPGRAANAHAVVEALGGGPASATDLVEATGLTRRQLQHALAPLREAGQVVLLGSAGDRRSRYSLPG